MGELDDYLLGGGGDLGGFLLGLLANEANHLLDLVQDIRVVHLSPRFEIRRLIFFLAILEQEEERETV